MIITKERDDKNFARGASAHHRSEFPKLILEDEAIAKNEVETSPEKTLTSREIITFLLFCTFFIIVVYLQVNIGDSYSMNNSIQIGLSEYKQQYREIKVEQGYWLWLGQFVEDLYSKNYYEGFEIPTNRRYSIPNLNILATPLRITQRRMRLVPNND